VTPPRPLIAANLIVAGLCLVAATLQYNDPDPLRWIALYGAAAVATVAALHARGGWRAALLVAAVAATWAAIVWSGVVGQVAADDLWRKMSEKGGKVEEYREAGGLTLVAAWLLAAGLLGRRSAPAPTPAAR
jgi:hypothetical protein